MQLKLIDKKKIFQVYLVTNVHLAMLQSTDAQISVKLHSVLFVEIYYEWHKRWHLFNKKNSQVDLCTYLISTASIISDFFAGPPPENSLVPLALFFPISVASIVVPTSVTGKPSWQSFVRKSNKNIRKWCEKFNITGIIFNVSYKAA